MRAQPECRTLRGLAIGRQERTRSARGSDNRSSNYQLRQTSDKTVIKHNRGTHQPRVHIPCQQQETYLDFRPSPGRQFEITVAPPPPGAQHLKPLTGQDNCDNSSNHLPGPSQRRQIPPSRFRGSQADLNHLLVLEPARLKQRISSLRKSIPPLKTPWTSI